MITKLKKELESLSDKGKARLLRGFFKTAKGQYGEGDMFLGVTVPQQRSVAKKYLGMGLSEIKNLLNSSIHEHRLTALFILIGKYRNAGEKQRKEIFDFYLKNTKNINNWDLVDSSAPKILGNYLLDKDRKVLYSLARSENIWERRMSILSTLEFICNKEYKDALAISEILVNDSHDLVHKAVGWMLREVGKRISIDIEEGFLRRHYREMPRTMLRYAVERFPEGKKRIYMAR